LSQGARRNAAQALRALGIANIRGNSDHRADEIAKAPPAAGASGPHTRAPAGEQWVQTRQKVAQLDAAGVVVAVNDEWQAGIESGELITARLGTNYPEACEQSASEGVPSAAQAAQLTRHALAGSGGSRRIIYRDERSWYSLQVFGLPAGQCRAVVVLEDITTWRRLQQDLHHRAFHDPLTGLPNRALLTDRLEHAVAGSARETRSLAVLFIDLDDFKSVNDRLGHLAGDATLCEAARRLEDCVRTSDTVGRWGGDEFVVVAERLDISVTADSLADRIAERLREPMEIADQPVTVEATIGVAVLEDHASGLALVEAADRALISARRDLRRAGRPSRRVPVS
jgi:diguanylate cyclase (GGDEF)-like protein